MTHLIALNNAKKALKEHLFTKFKGDVVGIGIGHKTQGDTASDQLALVVYVRQKKHDLPDEKRIDRDKNVHAVIDREKVQLDIKEIGHIKKLSLHQQKHRPVCGGISEGHYLITTGTGSVLVKDENGLYRLSNNHVYANENNANINDPIYQPGPYDGGTETDRVGGLADFVRLRTDRANLVDAAIRMASSSEELETMCELVFVPESTAEGNIGDVVVKSGRTTGVTFGRITDLSLDLEVEYDVGLIRFDNQILVESNEIFSQGGDSGSAIFRHNDYSWVGLLFAGSDDGRHTICNHSVDVCKMLGVSLYVRDGVVNPPPTEEPPVELPPMPAIDKSKLVYYIVGVLVVVGIILIAVL